MTHSRLLTLTLLSLAACEPDVFVDREKDPIRHEQRIPVTLERDLDLLWVVDNSINMQHVQEALAAGLPSLIEVLDLVEGGRPSLHIGVVSSNVGTAPVGNDPKCEGQGDDGLLQLPELCAPLDGGARFIEDLDTGAPDRVVNYAGTLEDQLACMAQLGTSGCAFEQHLESMKRALQNDDENAGFLRQDALLAVLFVQDEDDCSASDRNVFDPHEDDVDDPLGELSSFRCFEFGTTCDDVAPEEERIAGPRAGCRPDDDSPYIHPTERYVRFLEELKGDPERVIVGAIAPPAAPVVVGTDPEKDDEVRVDPTCVICPGIGPAGLDECSLHAPLEGAALVTGYPSVRMSAFADAFPGRSTVEDVCGYDADADAVDLRRQLRHLGGVIRRVIGTACLDAPAVDDCTVTDILPDGSRARIPTCDEGDAPCYRFVRDREQCPFEDLYPSGLRVEIDRGALEPADGTVVEVSCRQPD